MQAIFQHSITIQASDIDSLGHVNNVVYLRYVQEVAEAHWETCASDELKKAHLWVVLRHEIDYKAPAFLGQSLLGRTWVEKADGAKVWRYVHLLEVDSGKLVAQAKTLWCLLDAVTKRPKRITEEIDTVFDQSR
ncbi:thioesterase family protein [Cytophagales bacterium LB-30]|uniref:Thioesterase family protein n=1 Tax=Shiella aurantiaca TaxID=3058365 RepID=A0ABT8F0G8_9BACT|nr:thioesterase family protein [Shiella aurantiaca]MDN4163922.1 thioesterase family protein [Shiella aurantiaca]